MKKRKTIMIRAIAIFAAAAALSMTASAVSEQEVQNAIAASSKEEVAGSIFIWFLCAVGFLKVSQKIDSFMSSLGVNVGRTGSSMIGELMLAGRAISHAASAFGGNGYFRNHSGSSRTSNVSQSGGSARGAAGAGLAGGHGLIGVAQRAADRAAVSSATGQSGGIKSVIGGAMFASSLDKGGSFATNVISSIAHGNISSTGSMTGEQAASALNSYLKNSDSPASESTASTYRNVEIGGGRITGYESVPDRPGERQFAMYSTEQYMEPTGDYEVIKTADGASWYKQNAEPVVKSTPHEESNGKISYEKRIIEQMPQVPKRKDRV